MARKFISGSQKSLRKLLSTPRLRRILTTKERKQALHNLKQFQSGRGISISGRHSELSRVAHHWRSDTGDSISRTEADIIVKELSGAAQTSNNLKPNQGGARQQASRQDIDINNNNFGVDPRTMTANPHNSDDQIDEDLRSHDDFNPDRMGSGFRDAA